MLGLLSCCWQELEAGGASRAVDIPTSTPCMLVAHHQGVFISMGKGLQEAVVAVAPTPGAPRWASCSWGRLGRLRDSTTSTCFLSPFIFFFPTPPKRIITVFETLSGGHFGEDAIFLCHVMLFPHLTLATLSQQSTALPRSTPSLFSGAPVPGLGPERLEKAWLAGEKCQQ